MLGERLKALRKSNNMTQGELGEKIGLCASTIGMYEQNRREPDFETLAKICSMFDVNSDYLLIENPENLENSKINSSFDLEDIIGNFRNELLAQDGLMFNGVVLSLDDKRQVLDAIELGAQIALSRKNSRNNSSD